MMAAAVNSLANIPNECDIILSLSCLESKLTYRQRPVEREVPASPKQNQLLAMFTSKRDEPLKPVTPAYQQLLRLHH